MVHTFSHNNNIYSVDMMFKYIKNIKSEKYKVNDFLCQLTDKCWWKNNNPNIRISPLEILKNKNSKEYNRIIKSDLRYPIIITIINEKKFIIDGCHRLSKACLLKKKYIRGYFLNKDILNKCLIYKKGYKNGFVDKLSLKDINKLYKERFN